MRPLQDSLDELFELLRIPSISSGDGSREDRLRAASWIAERLGAAGGSCEDPEQTWPLVVGRIPASRPGAPHLLVYGHYDVQSPGPPEAWTSPPFDPVVRDGKIYARGAADDKGVFHSLLSVLCDLARAGDLPADVTVLADGEEEVLGTSPERWVAGVAELPDAALLYDGFFLNAGRPQIWVGMRGTITGRLTVRTGRADVHSGVFGGSALNAAHVLCALVARTAAGPDGGVAPAIAEGLEPSLGDEVTAAMAALADGAAELERAGIAPIGPEAADRFHERTLLFPSFDVNAITCRDASVVRTIVPASAEAAFSIRLANGQSAGEVWDALAEHLQGEAPEGATVELERISSCDPAAVDPGSRHVVAAKEAIERATGMPCALTRVGGSVPLMAELARRGVPTIFTGCGLPTDNIHAPDEHLAIAQYELGRQMARELIVGLADATRQGDSN